MKALSVVLVAAFAAACSSNSGGSGGGGSGSFASQFCAKAASCGDTVAMCQGTFGAVVISPSCQQMLENVTCAVLAAPNPPTWWSSCFPPCTGSASMCNGDGTISTCSSGMSVVLDCSAVCTLDSLTYTGTCSTSFGSQTSSQPKCWCH